MKCEKILTVGSDRHKIVSDSLTLELGVPGRGIFAVQSEKPLSGIAQLAINAAQNNGMKAVALSGGVAYNRMIRETIRSEVTDASLSCLISHTEPLGDGCVSFGQCVYAGALGRQRA